MQSNALSFPITGMGVVTPAGLGINPLWDKCLAKETLIQAGLGRIESSVISEIWNGVQTSKWIKKKSSALSKSLIFSLSSIISAIDEAGWKSFLEDDIIIIGTTTGQIELWEKELIELLKIESNKAPDFNALSEQPLQSLSDNLKYVLDFPGRILILSSACSASTQAVIAAHHYLGSKRAGRCIVGGVEELSDLTVTGFSALKLLLQQPCKPFDSDRVGINLSEGAAFYTIESQTKKSALAYLYAGESVLDSYHMTSPSVNGEGMQKALQSILRKNNLSSEDISFVHAHGTGSIHNDQAEARALTAVFPHQPLVVSTKGIHGHALGASGAIELGICLKILTENLAPGVTGLSNKDENIHLNLPIEKTDVNVNWLVKTTLGFGGVNSTFILGKEGSHA